MNLQWLKLDVNILDNDKIKLIRKYPDGDSIIILWLGIICLGMKSDRPGIIKIADGLPYTDDDLSSVFEIPVKTVQLGIELFLKFGMVQVTEGGFLEIINFRKHQSIDEIEYKKEKNRLKVAKWRQKQQLLLNDDVTVTEVTCNEQIREEKIRKEKNRTDIEQQFNDFWNLYDKKTNREKCYKKFCKLSKKDIDIIFQTLPEYIKSTPNKQYRKNPETYLNNKSWNDEIIFNRTKQSAPIQEQNYNDWLE